MYLGKEPILGASGQLLLGQGNRKLLLPVSRDAVAGLELGLCLELTVTVPQQPG